MYCMADRVLKIFRFISPKLHGEMAKDFLETDCFNAMIRDMDRYTFEALSKTLMIIGLTKLSKQCPEG